MNKIALIFVFLSAAAVLASAQTGTGAGQDVQEENVQSAPAIKEADVNVISPRDESWPRPFVPSEKIGADSVVSFPADI
jgi:predicted small secreted protein